MQEINQFVADRISIKPEQVDGAIKLFQSGYSIPFISRYRKDHTGNLDEETLKLLYFRFSQFNILKSKKDLILKELDEKGELSDKIKKQIEGMKDEIILDDCCNVLRQWIDINSKKSYCDPIVDLILLQKNPPTEKEKYLHSFLNPENGVSSIDDILRDIHNNLVERLRFNLILRSIVRERMLSVADLISKVRRDFSNKRTKYEGFYNFRAKLKEITYQEFFMIKRGVQERVLSTSIQLYEEPTIHYIESKIIKNQDYPFLKEYLSAVRECYRKYIFPDLQDLVLKIIERRLEKKVVKEVSEKFYETLMIPGVGEVPVIGVIPAQKGSSKFAIIDAKGTLIDYHTIHPFFSQHLAQEARQILLDSIKKYEVKFIAVSNEQGAIEFQKFFNKILSEEKINEVYSVVINNVGSNSYPQSKAAGIEFPNLDSSVLYAVSIARKLQSTLGEFSRLNLSQIKINQFQQDVDQEKLSGEMDFQIRRFIAQSGVNINSASEFLLSFVPGLNPEIASSIKKHLEIYGTIKSREELKQIPKLSSQAFEESSGFLLITESENLLDNMFIHPDTYYIVKRISHSAEMSVKALIKNRDVLKRIDPKALEDDKLGIHTIRYIIDELINPSSDSRKKFKVPKFQKSVGSIDELKEGMIVEGVVSHITNFGVFVDIGLEQNALIHISEFPEDVFFIDPSDCISIGQIVRTSIVHIDREKNRINLSLKKHFNQPLNNTK